MDFSEAKAPRARELATPTPHYAKRKRGPEVAADGIVLSASFPASMPGQLTVEDAPEDVPALDFVASPAPPAEDKNSCGDLQTVPNENHIES